MSEKSRKDRKRKNENVEEVNDSETTVSQETIDNLALELDKAKKETEAWKNKYYETFADMDNLRKNLEKDHSEAIKYRSAGFIEELIPALDSFYIALGTEPNSDEARNYKIGFEYIYKLIQGALEKEGVKEVFPKVGDDFDPTYQTATDVVETEGKANVITKVYSQGYYLKDRLIRSARVQVSRAKVEPDSEEENKDEAYEA